MPNVPYANFVLESKLTDLLNTKLNTRSLMTIDTSLAENAGMKKTINVYTYTGSVEEVAQGATNVTRGAIGFTPTSYDVLVYQQVFDVYDEEIMKDPTLLDMGMEGAAKLMINDMNIKYFAELANARVEKAYTNGSAITYEDVVDAISLMDGEDESGLIIIIGNDLKAELRKDADFMSARAGEILFNGQIGTVAGLPVVVSKLVPANACYIAAKDAITMFVKKESEVEQERDAEHRMTTFIFRKVGLVALTDSTKVVAILEYFPTPVITTAAIAVGAGKAFAGTNAADASVSVYKNGAYLAPAVVVGLGWTYTIANAVAADIYTVKASKANYATAAAANSITVA